MSADGSGEHNEELFFNFSRSDTIDQVQLFEEINKKVDAFLTKVTNSKEAADGMFDFLSTILTLSMKNLTK